MALDKDILIGEGDGVVSAVKEFLGVEREKHVCPHCNVACEETFVFDVNQAAFDGGKSPAWECPECSAKFHRDVSDGSHTMDLYGRQ